MKKQITTALLYTAVTAVLLGLIYPLAITAIAQLLLPTKANGQLLTRGGAFVGSRLIGQSFRGANYFHSRPSAAGNGYDAANSSGSNLGPTSRALREAVRQRTTIEAVEDTPVPVDLVTTSASGLDPDISPAAAFYQVPRVAKERGLAPADLDQLVHAHVQPRQFGLLGEPRVNVLELNLALDDRSRAASR